MTTPALRCTSGSDVVTVSASLLGYKPREAVALMMLEEDGSVFACMALSLDGLHAGGLIPSIHASGNLQHMPPRGHLVVIIFTEHLDGAQTLLDELHTTSDGLVGSIANIFITNWTTVWQGWDGVPHSPEPCDPNPSLEALRMSGKNDPAENREALLAYLREPGQPVNLESHHALIENLTEDEIETRLMALLDGPPLEGNPDQATLAAALITSITEGSRALVDAVVASNRHYRHQLAAIYARTPNDIEQRSTLLLLYGMSCWATRESIHAAESAAYYTELTGRTSILNHVINIEPPTV